MSQDWVEKYRPEDVIDALTPLMSDERKARIEQVLGARLASLTVVLEDLYDPRNGAAVIRSAEGFGLQDIHVVDGSTQFRACGEVAIGAQKWMTVHPHESAAAAAQELRARGFRMCATLPDAARTVDQLEPDVPWALWLGNEQDGLSKEAVALCDEAVRLPMHGFTRSYNLSVSAALCLGQLAPARRAWLGDEGDLESQRRQRLRVRWYAESVRASHSVVANFVSKSTPRKRVKSAPSNR